MFTYFNMYLPIPTATSMHRYKLFYTILNDTCTIKDKEEMIDGFKLKFIQRYDKW